MFINFIENCAETINDFPSDEFVEKVINQSGLIEHHMKEKGEKGRIRIENINELISALKSFELIKCFGPACESRFWTRGSRRTRESSSPRCYILAMFGCTSHSCPKGGKAVRDNQVA